MIYVDSCLVIYAVERDDSVGRRARDALAGSDQPLATSALVMLEALVGPMPSPGAQDARRSGRTMRA